MFIQQAYAERTGSIAREQSIWQNIAPLLVVIIIFYILVIRPQQKKLKNHQEMISNLKKGDKIITAGGIMATVSKLESGTGILLVEIAPEVKVKIKKETVSQITNANKKS